MTARDQLRKRIELIRDFSLRALRSPVRVVFYAGHGVQAKGRSDLIPVDVDLQGEDERPAATADAGELIDRLRQDVAPCCLPNGCEASAPPP